MQKVPGVQLVKVSLNEGMTILDLNSENSVTLASLRQIIRNNGFSTNQANVVVRGTVTGASGGLNLEVRNSKEKLSLKAAPNAAGAFDQLRARVSSAASVDVVISGSADTKDPKALVLSVAKVDAP